MIIIQTKTEDHFLNESLFGAITHDKENKKVRAVEPAPTYYENNFEDVEKVVYTNASNPTLWVSEGSELQRMKKRYDEKIEEMSKLDANLIKAIDDMRRFACDMLEQVNTFNVAVPKQMRDFILQHAGEMKSRTLNDYYRQTP